MRHCAVAIGSALLLAGCGSTGTASPPVENPDPLTVTRKDGSLVRFSDQVFASCDQEDGQRVLTVQSAQVSGAKPPIGFWHFSRATADIERSAEIEFPDHQAAGGEALFVLDPRTTYELSSAEYGSAGGLAVEQWGCDPGDPVRISVDGKLKSDVHGLESVTPVTGEIVGKIGD